MLERYFVASLCCFILLTGCAYKVDSDVLVLNQAIYSLEGEKVSQSITLPDNWTETRPNYEGIVTYTFRWKLDDSPQELWAVLLPWTSNNAQVYINKKLVGNHGSFTENTLVWHTPFMTIIPQGLLSQGVNIMVIKVQAKANTFGKLLPPMIGAERVIKPLYKQMYFEQVTLSEIAAVFAFTMGMSLLVIWWYRKQALYGWFALGSLSWSLYVAYFFVSNLPFPHQYWLAFCFANGFIMLSAMLIFICTFMGWHCDWCKKVILGVATVGCILLFSLPIEHLFDVIRWGMAVYAMMYSILGVALIHALRFEQVKQHAIVSLVGIGVNIGLGLHDWANVFFTLNQPYLLQYGQPFIFLVMGRHLLKDYMLALEKSEANNAELDRQVREREMALKIALEKNQQAEQEKLLLKERERIMTDIHDGVGGYLVSALSVAEASTTETNQLVSQNIHQALDELRIVIDSLDADEQSFPQMLADFRHRYQLRLEKQNIQIHWDFEHIEQLSELGPEQSLQVLRILQELITNIIKHAEATVIHVSLEVFYGDSINMCRLDVFDNGIGFDDNQALGRGLGNLKRRASSIGGEQVFLHCQQGTKARLEFPIR